MPATPAMPKINSIIEDPEALMERLRKHEGVRFEPYKCSAKKWTIGIGRNLDDVGFSNQELIWLFLHDGFEGAKGVIASSLSLSGATYLLINDINRTITELKKRVPSFAGLNDARKQALVDMCFNLGLSRFLRFKNMLAALDRRDWDLAAEEMLDSKWARQVGDAEGQRAHTLADMMQNGNY